MILLGQPGHHKQSKLKQEVEMEEDEELEEIVARSASLNAFVLEFIKGWAYDLRDRPSLGMDLRPEARGTVLD